MAHFKLNLEHSTRVIHHMEPIVDAQQKQLQLSSAFEDKRNPSCSCNNVSSMQSLLFISVLHAADGWKRTNLTSGRELISVNITGTIRNIASMYIVCLML